MGKIKLAPNAEDFPITANFGTNEFRCKCCGELIISKVLVDSLQHLRDLVDLPLVVSSGYRCPKHNDAIGGVKGSMHTKGEAADIIAPKGMTPLELAERTQAIPDIKRVGVYDGYQGKHGFIHIGISSPAKHWGDW